MKNLNHQIHMYTEFVLFQVSEQQNEELRRQYNRKNYN